MVGWLSILLKFYFKALRLTLWVLSQPNVGEIHGLVDNEGTLP